MPYSHERLYRAEQKAYARNWPMPRRPSKRQVDARLAAERAEAAERARRFQDRFKRAREEERVQAEAEVTQRAREAQATILETEAKKAEDQNWITEFTPQQEQEIAGYETAKGRVRSGVLSGDVSIEDGGRMIQAIDQRIGSYQKIRRPRRKDEPLYPEGQGVGEVWTTEGGTTLSRGPDGLPKLLVRPDQTPEYQQMKSQQAFEEKQRRAEEKRVEEVEKWMRDFRSTKIKTTVKDAEGTESVGERYPTSAEVYEAAARRYQWPQGIQQQQQQQQQQFGQLQSMPGVEPLAVQQARETKSRWRAERSQHTRQEWTALNDTIRAWEKKAGGEPITEKEARTLPPGTRYQLKDGSWWEVPR